jgi:phage terminase large subunit-like protein
MSSPPSASQPSSPFSAEWVQSLPPTELAQLQRLVTPRLTRYIPHRPHPPQAAFLLLTNREALFGGAAGGGKSDALLMAALQYVDIPGYSALLLRRSFAQLAQADALIPRAHEWLQGTDARWNEQKHTWTFPSGAVLKFGHLQNENDKYDYQGSAWHFVGFDELTQFSETQYTYLISRARRRKAEPGKPAPLAGGVPIRVRASANPGGEGHEWVKRRYLTEGRSKGRVFVPSKLSDNPSLDREDYLKSLAELDPVTRAQLLDGNWDVRAKGNLFKREWFKVIEEDDERLKGLRWIRYWDLAATEPDPKKKDDPDWTAGAKVAVRRLPDGKRQVFVRDVRRKRGSPGAIEDFVRATAEHDGKSVPIHMEEEPGSAGKNNTHNYKSRVLFGWTVHGHRKTGSKESFWGPLASQAEASNVFLVEGDWIGWWLEEAEAAPNPGVHDDGLDAVANGFAVAQTGNVFIT